MSDKTKKIVMISGLCAVAAGTVAVCVAGGDVTTASGIVTLTGAAVTAVSAVVVAIIGFWKQQKESPLPTVEVAGFLYPNNSFILL